MSQTTRTVVLAAAFAAALSAQDYVDAGVVQTNQVLTGNFDFRSLDLNGNGRPDLVIEAQLGPIAGIYTWMDPDLTSATATIDSAFLVSSYSFFGGAAQVLGFGDMNADGIPDCIVEFESPFSGGEILYLPIDAQGAFGGPVVLATAGGFTSAAIGDFDGNGETDFAFYTGSGSSVVEIQLQTAGVFQAALTIPGGAPQSMVAGDFDGDGDDDLALNYSGNLIVQPGGASFGAQLQFAVEPRLSDGYARDLDGDGCEDLALQAGATAPWLVRVFHGDPASTLLAATDVVPGGGADVCDGIAPWDVDGDGQDELLAVIRNQPGYSLIRHDGNRGFSPQPLATTMTGALIDLDLDGDLDQLVVDSAAGGYRRLENVAVFGSACSGAAGEPELTVGSAIPGNAAFEVGVASALPGTLSALFVSRAGQAAPCGPQIDLGQLYFPGLLAITDATGGASYPLPLPADLLIGPFVLQAAVLDPAGSLMIAGLSWSATSGRTVSVY